MKDAHHLSDIDEIKLLPEMDKVRIFNAFTEPSGVIKSLKFVLFNVERGKYLNEIEVYLKYHPALKDADVLFFNELDDGMARTGNMDTTAELSKRLSMNYIFGVEFFELTRGDKKEKEACFSSQNVKGLHGNAILSRFQLLDPILVRLPVAYDWFYDEQKRLGGRIALFSKIKVNNKLIGLLCTHLENRTPPEKREMQMKYILDQAGQYFGQIPIVIAGDMNTNTCNGTDNDEFVKLFENPEMQADRLNHIEMYEPILNLVESHGFEYQSANMKGKVTRRKPIEERGKLDLNLDWFFIKGLKFSDPSIANTIFSLKDLEETVPLDIAGQEGLEISDHNAISIKCNIEA